jgi:hypothetical protein
MRRKSKRVFETYAKYKPPEFREMKALPTRSGINALFCDRVSHIPSKVSTKHSDCSRKSVMDPLFLEKESPEVREKIIEKSRKIAPAYNKGAVQYVTDGTDLSTLGRKI